jgi:hypothetical protein
VDALVGPEDRRLSCVRAAVREVGVTGHELGTVALDLLVAGLALVWVVTPTYRGVLGERATARRRQRKGTDGDRSLAGPLAEHEPKSNAPGASLAEATPDAQTTGG